MADPGMADLRNGGPVPVHLPMNKKNRINLLISHLLFPI